MADPPVAQRLALSAIACAVIFSPAPSVAQIRNPCGVITKAEAEAVVGGPLSTTGRKTCTSQRLPETLRSCSGAAASGEATAMEIYCRCLVDAAVLAHLPDAEMRSLGTTFDDRTLKSASDHYPAFATERRVCYH